MKSSYLTVIIGDEAAPPNHALDGNVSQPVWNRLSEKISSERPEYTISDDRRFTAAFGDGLAAMQCIDRISDEAARISAGSGQSVVVHASLSMARNRVATFDRAHHASGQRASLFVYRRNVVWTVTRDCPSLNIGLSPSNDLRISDFDESERQARIELFDDRYFLVDSSKSGTLIFHAEGKTLVIGGAVELPRDGVIAPPWNETLRGANYLAFGSGGREPAGPALPSIHPLTVQAAAHATSALFA
jgi:hypothetical protein